MATTPTDDPLVNSDRTVGVRADIDDGRLKPKWDQAGLKLLKREALLFDQILIPELERWLPPAGSWRWRSHLDWGYPFASKHEAKELRWLRDIGVVGNADNTHFHDNEGMRLLVREVLAEIAAAMRKPIDVREMSDERLVKVMD
jgi:hypothetical protein